MKYNYAAKANGAKLIAANSEAKGAHNLLDVSKDGYLRNPRDAPRKWIVVELSQVAGCKV